VPVVAAGPPPATVIVEPRPYYWGPGPYYGAHVYYRFH
jgi:hypothetical protein